MFNLPSFFGGGGLPVSPSSEVQARPPGGMFNAWPTMLTGPSSGPSIGDAARGAIGAGGPIAALQFLLSSGGRSQAVVNAIRANAAKAGLADPFTTATPMGQSNLGRAFAAGGAATAGATDPMSYAAPSAPAYNGDYGYGTSDPYGGAGGDMAASKMVAPVPMPQPRPQMPAVPMPQPRPASAPQMPDPMQGNPYYGGPGSQSFGAGDGPSGLNTMGPGILAALFGRR